jgi:hypothetical protein
MSKHDDPFNDVGICLAYFLAFAFCYGLMLYIGLWLMK